MPPSFSGREAQRTQGGAVRPYCETARHQEGRDMPEGHDRRYGLRIGIQMPPRLGETGEGIRHRPNNCHYQGYWMERFIAQPLPTVTVIDDKAMVRCSRRLLKSVSASFESFTPAYVNPASAASIDSA